MTRRCAVEEIGRNSVIPCTTPSAADSRSVTAGPSGPGLPGSEVLLLLLGELVHLDPHGLELQPGDLLVDLLGPRVAPLLEAAVVLPHVPRAEPLVGEANFHDRRRVTLGSSQV